MTVDPIQVICPDCDQMIAVVSSQASVWAALDNHTCQHHHPRGNTMSSQPLRPVPDTGKRPHPRDLTNHPSKTIARAARKVLDAVAKLDEAWEADAAKAELRAKRDRLRKQLAAVEAELRGQPAPAKTDLKAIRAWAADNGYQVAPAGVVPKRVVDAYNEAQTT